MIKIKKFVLLLSLLSPAFIASSQNNTHSPYSARGIGEIEAYNGAYNRALGGVSNGIRSTRFISFSNPASISALKQVVFDFGFHAESGQSNTANASRTYYNGNFSYIVLGFPVWKKEILVKDTSKKKSTGTTKTNLIKTYRTIWSSAMGLTPYSNIGTSYFKKQDTTYGSIINFYAKTGGLSRFFIMNGVNLTKNISLGLNASYVFGQIRNNQVFFIQDSGVSRALYDESIYQLRGFKFDLGFQSQHHDTFTRIINKILRDTVVDKNGKQSIIETTQTIIKHNAFKLVWGATINNQARLNYDLSRLAVNASNYYSFGARDTVINAKTIKNQTYLPTGFSAGFSISYKNRWLFAMDYSSTQWANQKKPLFSDIFTNSSQIAIGVGYKPDIDIESMDKKTGDRYKVNIEYRFGLRLNNTGYNFKDNKGIISPLKETGISFGIGIPKLRRDPYTRQVLKSMINITGEYIHRGTTTNGMVSEDLLKLTIGVTLGDIWFTKRKFN
jgi:hypothetical protein